MRARILVTTLLAVWACAIGIGDALAQNDRNPVENSPADRALLVLRVDRELSWTELAHVFLENTPHGAQRVPREAARLRKRFQLIKDQLRGWMIEAGLLPDEA